MEYKNEPLIYIMEPFIELLSQEFKTSTISQDGNVDDDSFYIHSLLAEKEDMRDCGDISVYTMTIIREIASIKKGKDIFKRLSRDAARLDRLIFNNRKFTIPLTWATWVQTIWSGLWEHDWDYDGTLECWFDGQIRIIDFERPADLEDGHHQVRMIFECYHERIIDES